jgi:hypothetical protein
MKTPTIVSLSVAGAFLFYSCNKNEFPPDIADQEFSVYENSPNGTIVGAVEASDQDAGQLVSFEIIDGNEDGTFKLNSLNGILSVNENSKLDYEQNSQFSITVSATDSHEKDPLESSASIRILVIDQNEFSPVVEAQTFSIDENPLNGQKIGTIVAEDEESHQELIFSLAESEERVYFEIDPNSGTLSVKDSTGFDFEISPQYVLRVEVRDDHEDFRTAEAEITVNINDQLEITDGLAGYYPFSGDASDESGNHLDGQVNGPVQASDRKGTMNSAFLFDGVNDYILLGSDFDFYEKTISLFFRANTAPVFDYEQNPGTSWASIFTCDHPGLQFGGVRLCVSNVDGNNKLWFWKSGMEAEINPDAISVPLVLSEWTHVSLVIASDTVRLFLNGDPAVSYPTDALNHAVDGFPYFIVGSSRAANYRFFDGEIDDVYIHSRILEDWEIKNLSQQK